MLPKRLCPMTQHLGECVEDKCQWWNKTACQTPQCAVYALSISLSDVSMLLHAQEQERQREKERQELIADRAAERKARGW